jgi:hypothetical protein
MTIALNGSTGYLNHPARIANSYPFSMAVWVAGSTGVSNQFAIQQAQSNGDRYASGWFTTFGGNQLATIRNPGNSISATKTAAPALSSTVMRLLIVVFESATSRRCYFGSSTPTTDTATTIDDTSSHDRCTLGGFWANSAGAPSLFLTGSLAEAHWYNTALTGTDYTAMEGGTLPETIGGWVDGWTLETFQAGGTYTSIGGSRTMTAVGGVSASGIGHPITRTSPGAFAGAITLDGVTLAGSFSGTSVSGTITSEPLRTNNGTLLASTSLAHVAIYNDTTGALVLRRTSISTDGAGVFTITDAAIVTGTTYRIDWETAAGHRRMPRKLAS